MAELVSAYPTAGGIYWWASKLGGPVLGLVHRLVQPARPDRDPRVGRLLRRRSSSASSSASTTSTSSGLNFGDAAHALRETFVLFALILALHVFINIRGSHLVARAQRHLRVLARRRRRGDRRDPDLRPRPTTRASTTSSPTRMNNSGFGHSMFWWYVLPLGFLLTQYTITGFDASAHISEETHDAAMSAPKGVWQSVFYSAVDRLHRAAGDHVRGAATRRRSTRAAARSSPCSRAR